MVAFDKTLLENTFLLEEAKKLKQQNFLSTEEFATLFVKLPTLKYQNNLLIRFGFFLLGCFLYSSIIGMVSMVFMQGLESNYQLMLFVYAIIGFAGCEFLSRMTYRNFGLDNAFVLGAQIALIAAIGVATDSILGGFIVMFFAGLFCCIRYVNMLSALFSCIGITGVLCDLIIENHVIDMSFLPFVLFILAIGLYYIFSKLKTNPSALYYKSSLQMVEGFSYLLGYFSVNYLVVRELSEDLMNVVITGNSDIPFAFIFYGLTFIIPLFYLSYSLKTKNRIMLYIGFLTLCFSFFTIRYYYSVLPIETALILAGVLLFGLSYWAIKVLKNKDFSITFKPDKGNEIDKLSNTEALITNSQIDLTPVERVEHNMPFGGGGFSGGGSGGSF
ncbi:MAG TPA: hypothetical protein VN192_02635 [Flavobacterium sp.]|nr:hypothetical protein [Flavobacterium sp.]